MSLVYIALLATMVLCGLTLLVLFLFGLRNLTYGKYSPIAAAAVVLPILLFIILGFIVGDWTQAGLLTTMILLGLGALLLLYSGARGFVR